MVVRTKISRLELHKEPVLVRVAIDAVPDLDLGDRVDVRKKLACHVCTNRCPSSGTASSEVKTLRLASPDDVLRVGISLEELIRVSIRAIPDLERRPVGGAAICDVKAKFSAESRDRSGVG